MLSAGCLIQGNSVTCLNPCLLSVLTNAQFFSKVPPIWKYPSITSLRTVFILPQSFLYVVFDESKYWATDHLGQSEMVTQYVSLLNTIETNVQSISNGRNH